MTQIASEVRLREQLVAFALVGSNEGLGRHACGVAARQGMSSTDEHQTARLLDCLPDCAELWSLLDPVGHLKVLHGSRQQKPSRSWRVGGHLQLLLWGEVTLKGSFQTLTAGGWQAPLAGARDARFLPQIAEQKKLVLLLTLTLDLDS